MQGAFGAEGRNGAMSLIALRHRSRNILEAGCNPSQPPFFLPYGLRESFTSIIPMSTFVLVLDSCKVFAIWNYFDISTFLAN